MRNHQDTQLLANLQQRFECPDMSSQHLKNVVGLLVTFKQNPKEVKGTQITPWFRTGERIFEEFYNLGSSVGWNLSSVKRQAEVAEIISNVTVNQDWLQTFISLYPTIRVDLDGACPANLICKIRSGIELLLGGFVNINSNFDKVLKNLKESGDLEELDEQLKVWVDGGYRPDFFPGDKRSNTPESHWWWF